MKGKQRFLAALFAAVLCLGILAGCKDLFHSDDSDDSDDYYPTYLSPPSYINAYVESSSSIMISWNSVSGANYYYLYRSTSWFGDYYYVTSTSGTSYTDTGLSSSTTYYYKVSTISNGGESSLSNSYGYATTYSSYTDINGGWYYCTLSAGEYQYYRLYVYAGYTYDIIWEDYDYDSSLCDIEVSATWQNSGVEIFPPIDYDSASFYASSSGYVILKVKGRYDSSSGTYYIYSSTAVQM